MQYKLFLLGITFGIIPLLFPVSYVNAQQNKNKKEQLQKKKAKIENEIQYTNKLLGETKKNKKVSLNQLVILNKKITKRVELISTIADELQNVEKQIQTNSSQVMRLKRELKDLKDEYAKMIYYAYKNKNFYNRLMFIFASESVNQAYQRIKYFQQYSTYRKEQSRLIQQTQKQLDGKIAELNSRKAAKLLLLRTNEKENLQLTLEKEEQNKTLRQLTQKERKLLASLKEQESSARKLQAAIENIIAEEIRKSREVAKKAGKKIDPEAITYTPAEKALSGSFAANKGNLPWPSENGFISGSYGEHEHPLLKGIKIKNNGINITTHPGAKVRSVFEGTVSSVITIPNYNHVVIISHGEFLTVYSNLSEVYVSKGEKVSTKQNLGSVYTHPESRKTELHFELWKGKTTLNPASWIAR
ncbi:MAG: peptidoglycan DD-metalloendopeptidase family protein [Lentimicrobiaceae bacterium]|nr:peptidoglycan DD-metalloendopeptidase family protein [Lentimicrobiaceae bacterium]